MKIKKYFLSLPGYSKSLLFGATILFAQFQANSQCLTSSLNISTGFDPATGTITAPGPGTNDPRWTSSISSTAQSAALTQGSTIGSYDPSPNASWTSYTIGGTNWLCGLNDWGYNTTGAFDSYLYTDTFSRSFSICGSDSINFVINELVTDDGITDIILDGISIYTTAFVSGVHTFTGPLIYHFGTLSGTHSISIVVENYDNGDYKNATGMDLSGNVVSASGTASIINDSCQNYTCNTTTDSGCSDQCYWRVTGNHIYGANNIFGTLTNDDVNIYTNNAQMGIMTKDGMFGLHTAATATTAHLHVECAGHWPDNSGQSDVRFQDLQHLQKGDILIIDPATGYVFDSRMPVGAGGGINNSCSTYGIVPRTIDASGDLSCGQIYDDGVASVGINTTGPFGYTWSGGLTGSTMPPASGTITLDVNGVARALAYIATSDERFKTNIQSINNPFGLINGLCGKTYNWNAQVRHSMHADDGLQYGFIAQEVAKVIPSAVIVDSAGNYGINYNAIIPVLTEGEKALYKMLQEAKSENDDLQSNIIAMQQQINDLSACCAQNNASKNSAALSDASTPLSNVLYQNIPNPFENETSISYYIASPINKDAYIMITDLNGKKISSYTISIQGKGEINIVSGNLAPGMYLYTLVIDGNAIDTKKMILN